MIAPSQPSGFAVSGAAPSPVPPLSPPNPGLATFRGWLALTAAEGSAGRSSRAGACPRHGDPLVRAATGGGRPAPTAHGQRAATGKSIEEEDPVDPLRRHRASLAVPLHAAFASGEMVILPDPHEASTVPLARARSSLEDLFPCAVRRAVWSGDSRRATARIELGAGELTGATLVVHAEGGRVRVHLDVPAGVDVAAWRERIASSLERRAVPADSIEVT